MALKAKKPVIQEARFQALVYANRGVGKTHLCCSFPNSYYIDTEGLSKFPHFVKMLHDNGSEIVRLNDLSDIIKEVKELMSTKHQFKTIIIDSITFPVHLLANMEAERLSKNGEDGTAFGRNLAETKRRTFELGMLLTRADLNCIITAHEKVKYEKNVEIGKTSDVNDKLEYALGTIINIVKIGDKVKARIEKSRYPELKAGEFIEFENGYETLCARLGRNIFERDVVPEQLATIEQIEEFKRLIKVLNIPDEIIQKCIIKGQATEMEQMTHEHMEKTIKYFLGQVSGDEK